VLQDSNESLSGITEDSDIAPQQNVGAPEAYFDEKSSATRALGEFAKHTGAEFMPYLPKALEVLVEMAKFGFADVRRNALGSLASTSLFNSRKKNQVTLPFHVCSAHILPLVPRHMITRLC